MKSDCAHASALLSSHIDGMLDESQARALRLHLETCAACEAEYAQLVRIREALLRIPEVPLPAEFDARLRQALASVAEDASPDPGLRTSGTRARARRSLRVWSSVAAVFAIGLLSLFVYNNLTGSHVDLTPSAGGGAESAAVSDADESALYAVEGGFSAADAEEEGAAAPKVSAEEAGAANGAATLERADLGYGTGASAESAAESASPSRIYTDGAERPVVYERYERPGYPARGTTTGAHRLNEKALYDEMLKERLSGWTYEILWEEKRESAYIYRVNMIHNEAGAEFNQEIEVIASGNALHIYYATEFMGF
jgi:anti-sigma factor RsiW